MGLGPVKNGKQQVITPWVGSWAWYQSASPEAIRAYESQRDKKKGG